MTPVNSNKYLLPCKAACKYARARARAMESRLSKYVLTSGYLNIRQRESWGDGPVSFVSIMFTPEGRLIGN